MYHSRDLVNWRLVRNILDRPEQLPGLVGQSLDRGGIYAPQISYNPHNSIYYMITTDVGSKEGHFYVTATDPEGSWSNPVWLKGIDGIDPSLFFDDDGSAYIVYKEDTTGRPKWSNYRCIRFIAFDPESGQTVGDSWPLAEAGVGPEEHLDRDEGPHIYKIDGRYFLICAEGGTSNHHSAVIYRADSLRGEFTRWSRNPALTQRYLKDKRTNPITCTGHDNSAFKSIEAPNSEDVIKTAFAVMTFGQYFPNFLVLNPITVNAIDSEKDALGRNLGLVKVVNGIKYIASRPVVEYAGIPAGKYMLGDLNAGAHLVDYTSLTLEWAEDVEHPSL